MVVVSDATTLIVLEKRGRFDLLANLFHEVLIPTSVFNEINHKGTIILPTFMQTKSVTQDSELANLKQLLDDGVSEAIKLAKDNSLPLIIDEKKGRKIATNMGLKIIGLLGVIYLNIKRGYLSKEEAKTLFDDISKDGFRISDKLVCDMFESLEGS